MTAATGLKRVGLVLLAVVAIGAGMVFSAGSLISAAAVRRQTLNEIRAVTGLNPILRGPIKVSLFPSGRVTFADVALGNATRPALTAERLTAHLRFFPLLMGRVEIADVALENPTIVVDLEPNGHSNWAGLIEALAHSQRSNTENLPTFSEMRIQDGTVLVHNRAHHASEKLDDVDFSLAWPSISKSFGATGRFLWHDEPVDVSFTLSDFAAALAGNQTGLRLRISGAPINGAFEGALSVAPSLRIKGTLAADSDSLRDALIWMGQKPLPGGGFGHFAIKAQANVVGGTVGLTGVNVELDGNTAEGVLTFDTEGHNTVQGTLAANTLDLTPYISTSRLLSVGEREWNTGHIALDGLTDLDLDLRLSAAKVVLSDAKLGRTAIGANLRNGQLMITIGEAQAYDGVIKGSLTLAHFHSGVNVKSQLQFRDVNLESCLGQLVGLHHIEGKGDISVALEGKGDSVLGVTRTMQGTVDLTGEKGALVGLDVEGLLRRLQRRPLSGGGDFRSGRTPYDKINVALKVANGAAKVKAMTITGPTVRVALDGTASIPARELDLSGTATLVAEAKAAATPFSLPFIVQGSWDNPRMLPDAEALIRRSGAAAPLLDAVRERNARDAVRAVLERLTSGGDHAPTPPSPAGVAPAANQKAE